MARETKGERSHFGQELLRKRTLKGVQLGPDWARVKYETETTRVEAPILKAKPAKQARWTVGTLDE